MSIANLNTNHLAHKMKEPQLFLLVALFLVRFGCGFPWFTTHVIIRLIIFTGGTYLLSFLFYKTIPKEERGAYNLLRPSKKTIVVTFSIALAILVTHAIMERFIFRGGLMLDSVNIPYIVRGATLAPPIPLVQNVLEGVVIQFTLNALPEEFLFRGFFWGYMSRFRLSPLSILLMQAILFWGGHFFYYQMPFRMIMTLIGGIIFGFVAWKTKSLFMSGIVHAFFNASTEVFRSW